MAVTIAPAPASLPDRNNDVGALLTFSAQGAGTTNSARVSNHTARGVKVVVNVTAITGSITVTIEGYDSASGAAFTLLTSAAIAATGTTVLTVYPGLTAVVNSVASDHLPPVFDVKAVIATGPCTATVSVQLLI